MTKIVTIIGARPQFIKTPLISGELKKFSKEILVHTGQHYDINMSDVFIKELKIKKPDYNLGVGSGSHGYQTGQMLEKIERVLLKEKPSLVIVYGDTNSTVAGSLAAAKLHIPVAHVEAGMRSYNRAMPEEINRVLTDHTSSLLFCPTKSSVEILKGEGITKGVYQTGDVMADIRMKLKAEGFKSNILEKLGIKPKEYLLTTVHRAENTDNAANLRNIITAFTKISEAIIFPAHPRTVKCLKSYKLDKVIASSPHIRLIEPVGFFDMLALSTSASLIMTDSGGVQKEAYLDRVPCVTLRDQTEWIETVETGWNRLTGANTQKIIRTVKKFPVPKHHPNFMGDGKGYVKIAQIIKNYLK